MRYDLLEPYDLGKYDINLTEVLDGLDADEEIGEQASDSNYRLYRNITDEEVGGPIEDDYRYAILHSYDDGRVSGDYYATVEEVEAKWDEILDEWVEDGEDEEEAEMRYDGC